MTPHATTQAPSREPADLGIVFPAAHRRGGVERVALDVLGQLANRHSTAFIGEELDADDVPGIQHHRVAVAPGLPVTRPYRFRAAAQQVLSERRPRTLLSFGATCPPGDVYWVHSVHRAWLTRGHAVRRHGVTIPNAARRLLPRHRVLLAMEHAYFTGGRPRLILCTSAREADDLAEFYGVDPAITRVVPNGYDAERFSAATRTAWRGPMRDRLAIQEDDVSLLFVVNELHRKGFATLLDAVALTRDQRFRIDIVGRAAPTGFAAHIARHGLDDRVHWHGPSSHVERYLAAGDLLVLPTQYEPFGLVIVEALATGLPVITTTLAGAAEAVADGQTGRLQRDPTDAEELAELLREAADPATRATWAERSPESVARYDWRRIVADLEPLLLLG